MIPFVTAFMSSSLVFCFGLEEESYGSHLDKQVRNIVESIINERTCDKRLTEEVKHLRNKTVLLEIQLAQQAKTIGELQTFLQKLQNIGVTSPDNDSVNENKGATKEDTAGGASDTLIHSRSVSVEKVISTGRRVRRQIIGKVAFSAYLTATNSHTVVGQAIKFDQVLLNDGHGYNKYTGAFTAPLSGVYLFTFHVDARKLTFVRLVVNGVNQVDAVVNSHTNVESRHAQSMGGNTAIVHVGHGEAVLVETFEVPDGETASSNNFRLCTFSGVLLY